MREYFGGKPRAARRRTQPGKTSLKAGDVVLRSEPFAMVVEEQWRGMYCHHCLAHSRDTDLHLCKKGCSFCFFCSDDCEERHLKQVHGRECGRLQRYRRRHDGAYPTDYTRLVARIILRLQEGGDQYEEKYSHNQGRKFKDLMSHYKDIKEDKPRMENIRHMMEVLKEFLGPDLVPNESEFVGIYGRSMVNRFCISDAQNQPMGSALYLSGSIFDHSCMPNAVPSFVGQTLYIRTLYDIPDLNYDKVRISYIDCINTKETRNKDLLDNWYFSCDCELCNDNERIFHENFIMCPNPSCDSKILVPDRYNKAEMGEQKCTALPGEDSSETLKRALEATKMEYSFAHVAVNPFRSTDALMSYLYADTLRFKPAPDSDLTEESSTDEEDQSDEDNNLNESCVQRNGCSSPVVDSSSECNDMLAVIQEENYPRRSKALKVEDGSQNGVTHDSNPEGSFSLSNGIHDSIVENGNGVNDSNSEIVGHDANINGSKPKESGTDSKETKRIKKKKKVQKKLTKRKDSASKTTRPENSPGSEFLTNGHGDVSESESISSTSSFTRTEQKTSLKKSPRAITIGSSLRGSDDSNRESEISDAYLSELERKCSLSDFKTDLTTGTEDSKAPTKVKRLVKKAKKYDPSNIQCQCCDKFVDRNVLREYRSAISFTMQRLKDMKEDDPNFAVILDVLERQGEIVPPRNVWRVRSLDFAFNAAFQGGAMMLALRYGNENLDGMRYHYGESHPSLGLFYVKLAKANLSLKLFKEGIHYLDLAKKILKIAVGPEHPFLTREVEDIESLANEDVDYMFEKRQKDYIRAGVDTNKLGFSRDVNCADKEFWEREKSFNDRTEEDSKYFGAESYSVYY